MKAPYLPLYVKDWLCSRHVLAMPGSAVKAYIFLLCEAWSAEPRATLPDNDFELQSMARVTPEEWLLVKPIVMERFAPGTCEEHKGRLVAKYLIEVSRRFENKSRPGNSNAEKRGQITEKSQKKRGKYSALNSEEP